MTFFRTTTAVLITTFLAATAATAQNQVAVGSNFLRAGAPLPRSCEQQVAALKGELSSFSLPAQWRWIIVCDDASWQSLMLKRDGRRGADLAAGASEMVYASTDLAAHLTIVRGTMLLDPDSLLARPEHVVAHELGHILLQTEDEGRAETWAIQCLKQCGGSLGTVAIRSGDLCCSPGRYQ